MYRLDQANLTKEAEFSGFLPNETIGFLPNNLILAATADRSLKLWSTSTGHRLNLENARYEKNCQKNNSELGDFLVAGSSIGVFTDSATAQFLCGINRNSRALDEAFNVNQYLAFGLDNQRVEVWSQADKPESKIIQNGKGKTKAVAITKDGRLLAAGSDDGMIRLYQLDTMELLRTLDHHTAPILDLVFSSDGKMLISSSEDGSIEIWGLLPS